jgi:hypothetical protein
MHKPSDKRSSSTDFVQGILYFMTFEIIPPPITTVSLYKTALCPHATDLWGSSKLIFQGCPL